MYSWRTRLAALFCGGKVSKNVAIVQVMPTPIRTVTLVIAFVAVVFYWWMFLAQPVVDGLQLNRAWFVLSALLVPEGYFFGSWTDNGRLPLGIMDRAPILFETIAWLALAMIIGTPFCKGLDSLSSKNEASQNFASDLVSTSLACLCGLALLSTLTLFVGLAGGLHSALPLLAGVLVLMFISGSQTKIPFLCRPIRILSTKTSTPASNDPCNDLRRGIFQRVLTSFVIAATLWLGIVIMLGSCLPPTEFDVVEYHLQAAKEFYQAGRIDFVPHNIYINMPLGAEMHSLAAMTLMQKTDPWSGGLSGKAITAAISIVGAILLGGWVAQRIGRFSGWSAAGIWLGTPGITHVATLGLIDGVLATYVLATAIAVMALVDRSDKSTTPDSWTVALVCLLGGATAALKYPGLIYATLPCLLWVGFEIVRLFRRRQSSQAWRVTVIAIAALSVTCVPWYAKNWYMTGNPVYPLAANYFGGKTLTPEKIAQWQAAHRVPAAAPADAIISQRVLGQARQFTQDIARISLTSPFVQPAMSFGVICAIVWLVRLARHSRAGAHPTVCATLLIPAAWAAWILCVWWFATHRIDRFWLPVTGLGSLLAAWGLWQVRLRSLALAQTMLVSGLFYAVLICSSPIVADNRYFVSLAALRNDLGADPEVPLLPPAQVWINQNLNPADTRVLMIGEARVFPYRVPVIYSTCFDKNPGEGWLAGKDAPVQREALAAAGITHVLINWSELQRYRSPGNYGFSDWPQPGHVEQLVRDRVLEPVQWAEKPTGTELFKVSSIP